MLFRSLIAREAGVDLKVSGTGDVAALARWGIDGGDLPAGMLALEGRVSGPMADPQSDVRVTSPRVAWQGAAITDLVARAHVSSAAARIDELAFGIEGGRVTGMGTVPFDNTDARVEASWTGIDGARLVRMIAPAATLVPAATISGQLAASGPAANVNAWSADIRAHLAPAGNARNRLAAAGDAHLVLTQGKIGRAHV